MNWPDNRINLPVKSWYKPLMPVTPVYAPLLNANEPEARLRAIHVAEGQAVSRGEIVCTLETTKSTMDVEAPATGYLAGFRFAVGQPVPAGELLFYIAEAPDWKPPAISTAAPSTGASEIPPGVRITQPALTLARQHRLELAQFPPGKLITEEMVRQALRQSLPAEFVPPAGKFDSHAILIYGGGGHGKALIELIQAEGTYQVAGIVDDSLPVGARVLGLPVLGGQEILSSLYQHGLRLAANAVGGIGNVSVRIRVFERLAENGFDCPTLRHPTACIEASAVLSPGVQVMPKAYIGSEARLGFGVLVNTGAIVSHDCEIGEYANISPGAMLAGEVQVGRGALIGMGATINLQVRIGAGARIGNSATVKADVPENGLVRAGAIWPE